MRALPRSLRAGLGLLAVAGIAASAASCVVKTPSSVACGVEERPSIDCSSEVKFQGYQGNGGFGILNLASGAAKFEEVALRRISDEAERFVLMQSQLCKDYNACALDKQRYEEESRGIRDRLAKVPGLVDAVKRAPSLDDRTQALDELYQETVPEEKRVEEVTLRLAMEAELPASAGGQTVIVQPGMPLPTNTRASFWVEVKPEAYVYIFQKTPSGGLTVLFPDERIGTKNPLAGSARARIPNGDLRFRLNDKDLGVENVYIAASRQPQPTLDAALARVREGKVSTINQDSMLSGFNVLPAPGASSGGKCRAFELEVPSGGSGGCTRSRGLELDAADGTGGGGSSGVSFVARTEPGDGLIVKVFTFEHTTEGGAYADALKRYQERPRTRGGQMLERTGGKTRGGQMLEKDGGQMLEKGPDDGKKPKTRGGQMLE